MNTTTRKRIRTGLASLIAGTVLIAPTFGADAAFRPSPDGNKRPRPAVADICPAIDLVPECIPRSSDSSTTENGSPRLPRTLSIAGGGGGAAAVLNPGRTMPSPQ